MLREGWVSPLITDGSERDVCSNGPLRLGGQIVTVGQLIGQGVHGLGASPDGIADAGVIYIPPRAKRISPPSNGVGARVCNRGVPVERTEGIRARTLGRVPDAREHADRAEGDECEKEGQANDDPPFAGGHSRCPSLPAS
jgi:hypothetical protein